jgi:hypothetical protein
MNSDLSVESVSGFFELAVQIIRVVGFPAKKLSYALRRSFRLRHGAHCVELNGNVRSLQLQNRPQRLLR